MKKPQVLESDIFSHLTSLGYLPRWIVLIFDVVVCNVSFIIGEIFARGSYLFEPHFNAALPQWAILLLLTGVCVLSFWIFHTYSGIIRYSNFVDIVKLFAAVSLQLVILLSLNTLTISLTTKGLFMRLALLFYCIISFILLMMSRLVVKVIYDYMASHTTRTKPVAVYGTKSAGIGIAKMVRSSDNLNLRLAAFLSDSQRATNKSIFNVPVIPTDDKERMLRFLKKRRIRTMIVSPLKMKEIVPERDLEIFLNNDIEILTMPTMNEWHENDENVDLKLKPEFRNLQIEELLNRNPIVMDKEHLYSQIKCKVVMVTGAAGSIGSEIVRQVAHFEPRMLVLFDCAETPLHNLKLEMEEKYGKCPYCICIGDMRNRECLENIISTYRPNIIYHAAAYKHVPMMEDAPSECVMTNVEGTRNIADLAVKYAVETFVMISTDKAVNPTNVMGASKRIAEIYVQSLFKKEVLSNPKTTKFITTRFGNVLGSNGSVIPLFRRQIEKGGPVTVTHPDIIRYFMTIPEACQLVLEAGSMGSGGEIFIFDMGQPVKIVDLARKMIRLAGLKPEVDIPITYTGLRPGEKLYEELLNVKEITKPTYNEKILIANVREYDLDVVVKEIESMVKYAHQYKNYLVVSQMKHVVPEYISKNSQYERLDVENQQ